MGSESKTGDDAVATSPTASPDWGQFGLVLVAIAILALAAVAIPALGGGTLGFGGDDREADGPSALPSLFDGDGEQRSDGSGDSSALERSGNEGDESDDESGDETETDEGDEPNDQEADGDEVDPESDDWDSEGELPDDSTEDNDNGDIDDSLEDAPDSEGENGDGDWADGDERESDAFGEADEGGDEFGDAADGDDVDDGEFDDAPAADDESGDDVTDEFDPDDDTDGEHESDTPLEDDTDGDDPNSGDTDDGDDAGERTDGDEFADDDVDSDDIDEGDGVETGDETAGDDDETADDETGDVEATDDTGEETTAGDEEAATDGDEEITDDDDAEETVTDDTDEDSSEDAGSGTYDYALEPDPSPGTTVAVTVTENGDPVVGETVTFNGEPIGTTDSSGTVSGEVPYTQTLEVDTPGAQGDQSQDVRESLARGAPGASGDGARQFAPVRQDEPANETGTVIEMETNTTLAVDGPAVPGGDVTLAAAVNDHPIPDGTVVVVDGTEVGSTDANGTAQITLPDSDGNTTVAVERDEITAKRTIDVQAPTLAVEERVPLPGRTVDATLEHGDEPVENATVLVDGEEAGTTGADGTAAVQLPVASEATLGATVGGTTTETVIDGLYRNAALVALGAVSLVLAGLWLLRRRFGVSASSVRSLPARVADLVRRAGALFQSLGRWLVDAVVRLAHGLEAAGQWLAARLRDAGDALARAGRWLAALPRALATQGLTALAAIHPRRLYRLLVGALRSLLRSSKQRVEAAASSASQGRSAPSAGSTETDADSRTLRTLWREFVRLVRPPRLRTQTPGEIGRHAIKRGFPEPPVRTVVETFRDAEYGETPPSDSRLEQVQSAVRTVAGDDDGDDESDGTDSDDTETDENRHSEEGQP
ncbi:DUF4129 domain-containing protein [Natronolimnobius sp. AArcel1]|uniref:DUF4129 domain-containing protein n=1 Tax=Natronolimnobius sp. AArcel1 TaxID=1679093 RepID=UPI0013ECD453|nr:DUF4129 domain-containing protein [Natronolimnobius sp. AArcel1]NGM68930.1 DUF4129 domain-containing protein [Natronolimnobius sp. AArcel1]